MDLSRLSRHFKNFAPVHSTLSVTEVLVRIWRQRLWFEPHWRATALLFACTAPDATMSATAM
jgi:hypothetical protein